ncbi:FbpB family small basic protein [Sediminibacillus dalangtanensis]|uniref:FbpB family small basic protein n=1 Tax=Sediminibacillus dalangtanensis TaxID=2729421 RepID=A0ABX7VQC9_9BACI|nr:FbpB family small basic protein [Sediminibacillus dalangtanensis]QTM99137.1 FbpB family small basic protein [Sediminibacillus dalangtanensis]
MRKNISFSTLVEENKQELTRNSQEVERIEKRLDDKYLKTDKGVSR